MFTLKEKSCNVTARFFHHRPRNEGWTKGIKAHAKETTIVLHMWTYPCVNDIFLRKRAYCELTKLLAAVYNVFS